MNTGPKEKRVVFVTGACGWIGRNVCTRLKGDGHIVIACDLIDQKGPWELFLELDISSETGMPDRGIVKNLPSDPEGATLIHCAGHAHRPIETKAEISRFFAINADGTRRVIDWARSIGVTRLLYVSSIAFYDWIGEQESLPLAEDARVIGATAYAKSKLDGEEYVRNCGLDSRIVRLATVFGEGDRANFAKLANALTRGRFILPGSGSARKSVISIDKASEWIAQFALTDQPPHRLINLGFQQAPTLKEISAAYHEVCGFPLPRSLPIGLLKPLARIGDQVAKVKPGFPLTSLNVDKLTRSTWVDCGKAVELFPEAGELTFANALKESAEYYRL